jgi:hypothetical protein
MQPKPSALGLTLCDRIIVDSFTRQPSLISVFTAIRVISFPTPSSRFAACATLTGAVGDGIIELRATQVANSERIYTQGGPISRSR